mmetsp:Transcript_24667/g.68107  ORF Transcript_24667/g.68107 Transcript_24667/m.68107 type:complete len:320 (-) Transcript_24667:1368-2327(-)|eukprot:CAMPEP_0172371354 /NCGR_PEP_ID=MMETSP1060-20121228/42372_1 /TAXON_ID=37318 /ORGANISM="Pseudo-nitzschia pungens, Strain cf. cingulata" /LENGTH=319 /DNA_ID=CAMNT_0013096943 /DNA_START=190 /DNA_END=1149 /DNA_ORIENTATION=+
MTDVLSPSVLLLLVLSLGRALHTDAFSSEITRRTSVLKIQNGRADFSRIPRTSRILLNASAETEEKKSSSTNTKKENKSMAFLKKIGKIGGTKVDFTNAVGVDEGSGGAKISTNAAKWDHDKAIKKAKHAYRSCADSGTIDDLTETFPITSSGTQWAGVTDRVMGGKSSGTLVREKFQGRISNVLTANVSLENDGGFVQMVTDLALDPSVSNTVDASNYGGLEFDVFYEGDSDKECFNVHLKDSHCVRQFSSYRATFDLTQGEWTTVQLPWARFEGFGWGAVENLLDRSALRRIGLVAIGREMDVTLALSSIRFLPKQE